MARLRAELPPPGLTLSTMLQVEPEKLNSIIYGEAPEDIFGSDLTMKKLLVFIIIKPGF